MGFKNSSKASFVLPLFFVLCIFFTAGLLDKSYASDIENGTTESDAQSATGMEALLQMDIRDLMNVQVISATRSLKPISEVAENMTVITAKDIEFMNAHTIADVLNTVTGVQVFFNGGLGGNAVYEIQGSEATHTTVLIDDVILNSISSGVSELLSMLPVQIVERIEIIKGPASAVWGSSLGGIINIITKTGNGTKSINGTVSTAYGEKNTDDNRAEIYGAKDKFEYYLYAGHLQTDGLRQDFNIYTSNLYSKVAYNITDDTKVSSTFYYDRGRRGEGDDLPSDTYFNDRFEHILATLSLNSKLNSNLSLDLSMHTLQQVFKSYDNQISDGLETYQDTNTGTTNGASAKLAYTAGMNSIVVGTDYEKGTLKDPNLLNGRQGIQKWDIFINDTIVWNKLSVTPGLRFDNTDAFGSFISPTLGATYKLTDRTFLRATVSEGFNNPTLFDRFGENFFFQANAQLKIEEVTSCQAGIETRALPYVWAKVSAFSNNIRDALVQEPISGSNTFAFTYANVGKVRHQGVEAEIKTNAIYHTSLFAGASFIDSKDLLTELVLTDSPRYTFVAGLKYDDGKSLKAILQGHYIWFNEPSSSEAQYNSMILDMSITKTVFRQKDMACDVFLTAHNIFDGSQYEDYYFPNPGRWVEGGVRFKF